MRCLDSVASIFILCLFFLFSPSACPQDKGILEEEDLKEFKSARVTKTIAGLHFDVEEDRPIEKVDGTYRPVSIDTYVAIKFKKLRQEVEERFDAFAERLETLEAAVERLEKRPASAEAPAEPPAAPLTLEERITRLEDTLKILQREASVPPPETNDAL